MTRILLICLFSLISSPGLLFAREVVFYHTDNVGSPVAMTDSKGTVVWRANDLPFGEEYQTTENPQHNSRRFIGKEKDKETGLVYIGARYLDPVTGRFLQPDPVGPVDPMTGKVNIEMLNNPQRLNRYAYGLNNPYRYIDPDGLAPFSNNSSHPIVVGGGTGPGQGHDGPHIQVKVLPGGKVDVNHPVYDSKGKGPLMDVDSVDVNRDGVAAQPKSLKDSYPLPNGEKIPGTDKGIGWGAYDKPFSKNGIVVLPDHFVTDQSTDRHIEDQRE